MKKHTCERCGCEDPARGLQKHNQGRIFNTMHDGVMIIFAKLRQQPLSVTLRDYLGKRYHRTYISCRIYYRWLDTHQHIELELHTLFAEHTLFYIIDTETTGKLESRNCQIVEIAIINQDGQVVYHTLCKPDIAMPASASEISGITDDLLANAPTFIQIWPDLYERSSLQQMCPSIPEM